MVKIRLTGTREDVDAALEKIKKTFGDRKKFCNRKSVICRISSFLLQYKYIFVYIE